MKELKNTSTLSKRETEILKLVSTGLSSKEIAEHLNISWHTVTSHRKNIMGKFKVKNTVALIIKATERNDLLQRI